MAEGRNLRKLILFSVFLMLLGACNAPWNILSTKTPQEKREARGLRKLEKAKRLAPDLFSNDSVIKVHWVDSFKVIYKDSAIIHEKVNVIGTTTVICDTITKKPKPFDIQTSTGLVKLHMWMDTAGVFHYDVNQDSIKQVFRDMKSQQYQGRDTTTTVTISVPKIVYQMSFGRVLLVGGIGVGIGLIAKLLLTLFFGKFSFASNLIGRLRSLFKKTPGS